MKEEAMDIIEDLIETIGWLGGDSYEMDCIAPSLKKAEDFLSKHRPPKISNKNIWINPDLGIYTTKDNKGKIVRAVNRRNAKNILGVNMNRIKCIKIPGSQQ